MKKAKSISDYLSGDICACERAFVNALEAEGFKVLTATRYYDHTEFTFEKDGLAGSYKFTRQNSNQERIKECVQLALASIKEE